MQGLLFLSSIAVCLVTNVVLAGEVYEPSKMVPQQEYEKIDQQQQQQLEKVMADFSNNGRDFSDEVGQQSTLIRADALQGPSSRWYYLNPNRGASIPSSYIRVPEQYAQSLWPLNFSINRQLSKKQNHKKNPRANPRDILRGLAVKRDHFY